MNNLKKFSTEADYTAATLNYPAVSWVTGTDVVHFDKSAPTPPAPTNDKVMMAWHNGEHNVGDIQLVNLGSQEPTDKFITLTLNDVDVLPLVDSSGTLLNYGQANTDYLAKYGLKVDTTITDIFAGDLGGNWGSDTPMVDFLIPSQVTSIESLPSDVVNLVIEVATPPTTSLDFSSFTASQVFVPDSAVNTYKSTIGWSSISNKIYPISDYEGNLPV